MTRERLRSDLAPAAGIDLATCGKGGAHHPSVTDRVQPRLCELSGSGPGARASTGLTSTRHMVQGGPIRRSPSRCMAQPCSWSAPMPGGLGPHAARFANTPVGALRNVELEAVRCCLDRDDRPLRDRQCDGSGWVLSGGSCPEPDDGCSHGTAAAARHRALRLRRSCLRYDARGPKGDAGEVDAATPRLLLAQRVANEGLLA